MKNLLASALALVLAACSGNGDDAAIRASGHVEATEVRVAAKIGGQLAETPFVEGDQVRAGQVIARIDTIDLERELERARAEQAAAEARLRLLQSGSREEDVRRGREELGRAQAELDAANRDQDRFEALTARGTATEKARDDARTRREIADRGVRAARAGLDKLTAGSRREEIEAAAAQRDAAAAAVAVIQQRISDAAVVAPRDGMITERAAEPGEVLQPGALIAVLTDVLHPWLNVWVDEPSLASVRIGEAVRVRVDGRAGELPGRVAFVSPVAEFTPKNVQTPEERAKLVFRVKIALDNPDGVFKPGMPAEAVFGAAAAAAERR